MANENEVRDPLVAALCDGATAEEAREVLEALEEHFEERVRAAQYNPHNEGIQRRMMVVDGLIRRMERAAAGLPPAPAAVPA